MNEINHDLDTLINNWNQIKDKPESKKEEVLAFINSELVGYCQNEHYICDTIGVGAQLIND